MSTAVKATRVHEWMESLGDWSWPGTAKPAAETLLPPSWVPTRPPTLPPRPQPVAAIAAGGWGVQRPWPLRTLPRRLASGALASALAAASVAVAVNGPASLERLLGYRASSAVPAARIATRVLALPTVPRPRLRFGRSDEAGSAIAHTSYISRSLHGSGSFYVYLPPGYGAGVRRYPVVYLLHGNSQPATAFLQVGLQSELDRLISTRQIPPLIAVMIQGGPGANNWRNEGAHGYENYVLEVQEMIDGMLPTIATRAGRAIAGDSMGGYGAMHIALGDPYRFAVAESWIGFFDGLGGLLHADKPILARLGLSAYVYGAESDKIANPSENGPFAAALRGDGAQAQSAVVPGGHSLETVEANLGSMLQFAGRALAAGDPYGALAPADAYGLRVQPGGYALRR